MRIQSHIDKFVLILNELVSGSRMAKKVRAKNFFLFFLLFSSLFLTAGIFALSPVQAENQNVYHLALEGSTWNRTTLRILLITPNYEPWWNPSYLDDTLRAIGQWNEAIQYFASNYTNYAYLAFLKLEPTVSNQTQPGFDIYLNWTDSALENSEDIGGLTSTAQQNNVITKCTINLSTHTSHGDALADGDEQNIALHELGHGLGILCTNNTGEIMTPLYSLLSSAKLISTLDVYGVARVFAWMANTFSFYPVSQWLPSQAVILPSDIPYKFIAVSPQNALPETVANNPWIETLVLGIEILIHPDILAFVILFIGILVIIAIYPTKKKTVIKN